ncbi:flagellar protein FlaG [Saccharibacillus qingshengii]|uniref:flagellar protein FlaG n=1 Tax=Saccharibacillus qingshengii TaxID=1763540 RepID=UPI0015545563|nr:flagellar protein FlaG [Saccharibacillus qingshengii]
MNIQFSMTTNAPQANQTGATSGLGELGKMVSASRGSKDLDRLEQQGTISASLGEQQLIQRIEHAVKSLEGPQTTLDISIHEKTHEILVKVLNKETGEIIREVPKEKTLDLVAQMMELAGILLDKRV